MIVRKEWNDEQKTGIIIGVCTVAAVAVVAALSVFFYKENKSGSSDKAVTNTDEGDNLADGQIFDYEKAGYISLGKYKGLSVDVEPEVYDIYGAMMDDATENEVSSKDAIKSGDVVNIDFTGKKDGKKSMAPVRRIRMCGLAKESILTTLKMVSLA